ncbi:MAG TPA: ATP-binding protein [Anaerolineales bacterium]|nr:ATP-binding protein [Anaerolineales bacterium]
MMLSIIRRYLGIKLFLSYLIVIILGVVVLATIAELAIPTSFNRHMSAMGTMMSSMMGNTSTMESDLFNSFRTAVNEALILAASAAFLMAVFVSILVTRLVVSPLSAMKAASQHIAAGNYAERVKIRGDIDRGEFDELDQLALSFNRMAFMLERTESMRRQLIGDVAHELRTPLTTIQGYMEGLMDGVLPADDSTYQSVYREADRLKRLVSNLQELSRVESGAYELDRHPVPVVSLISGVFKRLEGQFTEKGVALDLAVPESLPALLVDEDRIGQVLLNLVGNALQYTPAGGQVTISAEQKNHEVQITVSDTGIGLSPEHLPYVFTRFYRVDKSRSRAGGGSGIGLTIARHLVEAHGGQIWAQSAGVGKGSQFVFTLPAAL